MTSAWGGPGQRGRPGPDERVGGGVVTPTVPRRGDVGALLTRDRPDYEQGWRSGYRVGFVSGREVGYGQRCAEEAREWRAAATSRSVALEATYPELRARRRPDDSPCNIECGRCSRCIRADSVRRRGGDFPGRGGS